ncbi:hypothetical protein GFM07_37880 [Rhizobium leguminosarum bv. viciae]|nr:hypothetical protein [Rhizobium leguminosarum bv. viciae]
MGDNLGWKTVTVITGIPAVHGVVRWRRKDLVQWLFQEFRISLDETTVGRELKALGFTKLSARPRHYAHEVLPDFGPAGAGIFRSLRCSPILGQRELEFSGVLAQIGGGADEPFISEIGTLLPMALCGRNSLYNTTTEHPQDGGS